MRPMLSAAQPTLPRAWDPRDAGYHFSALYSGSTPAEYIAAIRRAFKAARHHTIPPRMQDVLYKIMVSGHWMGDQKEKALGKYCTSCRQRGQHNIENIEHAYAHCPTAASLWEWAIGKWNNATTQQLNSNCTKLLLLADRGEQADALSDSLWHMLHAAVIWTLHTAAKRAREQPMVPADSMTRRRQNVQRTLQHLISTAWIEHANRGSMPWTDWQEEGWVSRPNQAGRPTAHILTRDYTPAPNDGDLRGATQLYTDGSWIEPEGEQDWEPASWGVAEMVPTTRAQWDTFPTAQWTHAGPLDDSQARLTWVDSGAVITEAHDPAYIGAPAHTNNTGELTAMYRAIERALGQPQRPHVIHSDSLYTIHMTTGRWRTRRKGARNRDLINATHALYRRLQRNGAGVSLRHVRSHIRVPGNEMADRLAGVGGNLARSTQWLRAWLAKQSAPGGLGDSAGVG